MAEDQVTVVMAAKNGEGMPVGAFETVLDNLIGMLRDVEPIVATDHNAATEWRITAAAMNSSSKFSVGATLRRSANSAKAVAIVVAGMRLLENGTHMIPNGFNISALERARAIVRVLDRDISFINIISPSGETVAITKRIAAQVDDLLPGEHYEIGSIEGRMETITVHGGSEFAVWDRLTGVRVACSFDEELLPQVHKSFNRRVLVSGRIRYTASARPESIKVCELFEFPDRSDLPQFSDLRGIAV